MATCNKCNAEIIWVRNGRKAWTPFNAEDALDDQAEMLAPVQPHYATCRKPKDQEPINEPVAEAPKTDKRPDSKPLLCSCPGGFKGIFHSGPVYELHCVGGGSFLVHYKCASPDYKTVINRMIERWNARKTRVGYL